MAKQMRMGNESKVLDQGGRPPALKSEQAILSRTIVADALWNARRTGQ